MGLRGPGAKPKSKTAPQHYQPWAEKHLKRWQRVVAFCESLTVTSGKDAGKKLWLRPWQVEFIKDVYREDRKGNRRVRTAIWSMGRKNGKTQIAAALALCHLSGPEAENRGEVYSCANDRFQASKILAEMVAMIQLNDWLNARTNIRRLEKVIEDLFNGSIYCALSAEAKTKMGLNPSFIVYDELGQAASRELYDAMDSAMGARASPLMLVISTQAADSYAPLSHLIDYGLQVQEGRIKDPAFHLKLYSAPEDADPWDIKTWKLANPALDDFRSLEDVERLAGQAQRISTQENAFRNLILNQRVAAEARFMDPIAWKACGGDPIIMPGQPVHAGLDLGSTRDLSALVLMRQDLEGFCHVKPYVWVPGDLKTRSDQDGVPYDVWADQGIVIPAGPATDPRAIACKIAEVNGVNKITALAFDRWRIPELRRELDDIGCKVDLVEHGQGFKDMSPAVDLVERLVTYAKLRHGNNPVLTWCVNNAVVLRDPVNQRKFDKSVNRYRSRIDALVAMAMALSIALVKAKPMIFDVETLIA